MTDYCQYIFSRGKRRDQQCDHFANYDGYCGKHKQIVDRKIGRSIKAKSDLNEFLNGEAQVAIPQKQKNKQSIFLLSINTNRTVDKMDQKNREDFKALADALFNENEIFDFVIKRYGREPPEDNLIVDRWTDFNYEVGEENHRLHLHAVIDIKHNSNLLIDLPRLRNFINEKMGYKLNVNLKVEKTNSLKKFIDYSNKNNESVLEL